MSARRNRRRPVKQRKPYTPPPPPDPTTSALAFSLVERGLASKSILSVDDYLAMSARKRIGEMK